MTRIAALSVQTIARPAAARAAAPRPAAPPVETPKAPAVERREPVADVARLAGQALAALIAAQAHHGEHEDPHPEHGHDGDHGHRPPPVVQPPVSDPPPVVEPPPPTPAPTPAPAPGPAPVTADPAAGARTIAMINKVLVESALTEATRSAFEAAAAERRSAAYVAQGQAALTLLQGVGRYEPVRRSVIG